MKETWRNLLTLAEEKKELVIEAANYIWKHPEIGYKEWNTSHYLEEQFEKLGYIVTRAGNIPGFIAEKDSGRPGPTIAVMGELDSLLCATHPDADKETGAVHACGHNCQSANLLGVAAVFSEKEAMEGFCGKIKFISVPAEETIDLEFRNQLAKDGIIKYMAGKIEFLYRGLFDDVDMAIMMHSDPGGPHLMEVFEGSDGCITKHMEFIGKAAHAGVAPWKGVNALYASNIAFQACNALRETFKESDYVRFHPIITQAGVVANGIPEVAKGDAYCRAANVKTMIETNQKINRALACGSASIGGNVHIVDKPGNLPLHNEPHLNQLFADIVTEVFGEGSVYWGPWQTGSCDVGDLSTVMPVCQPMITGVNGTIHGADFNMGDQDKSCMNPVRIMSLVLYELLTDDGKKAKEVIDSYEPVFASKAEYFEAIDNIAADYYGVDYHEDGSLTIKIS